MAPRELTTQVKTCVIAGGGINDPAPDHSCNQKIVNPLEHGDEVNFEDLQFSPMALNPTQTGGSQFPGTMDPGTLVYVLKNVGEPGGIILGLANSIRKGNMGAEGGGGGGQSLLTGKIAELFTQDIGVNVPPKVQEVDENGMKIRKIQEKGEKHSLSLLDGLPSHGALFDMAGFRLPALKQVPTAKQHNDQMMTNQMFDQLQGIVGSLQGLLQGLMQNGRGGNNTHNSGGGIGNGISYWDEIQNNIRNNHPSEPERAEAMIQAIKSLTILIQGHETDNGVGFVTGNVVHYGIYLENAVELLSNVSTIDDVMSVLSRLQWDSSLHGQDALDVVEIQIENAWGVALQQVDVNGNIVVTYANANAQMAFANSMSNVSYGSGATSAPASSGSGSGAGGQGNQGSGSGGAAQSMLGTLFGKSAQTLQDMWKRLAMSQEKEAKNMHQKLTQDKKPQKQKQINQAVIDGGDPLNKVYYQE
jgi:hypothetical protein